jgi:hypothetical protein
MCNFDLKVNPSNGDHPHLANIFSFFTLHGKPELTITKSVIAFFNKTTFFYLKIFAGLWHIFPQFSQY